MIACALFALAQIAIVVSALADSGVLCDDAFYYFQIAKHAAHGLGFSFDGVNPTNGFHPLLAWLAVPVFAVFDSAWVPVRIVLCLLGVATAATGYVLFRIGRALGDELAGELMTWFFLLSPLAWIIPLRGCEGGLSVLCIALVVWQAARMAAAPAIDARAAALFGALIGLAGLARTENVLLAIAAFGWLAFRTRRPRPLAIAAGATAAALAPWVIWNLIEFGSLVQVSGAAKIALHLYHKLPVVHGPGDVVRDVLAVFLEPLQFVCGEEFMPRSRTYVLLAADVALVLVAMLAGGRRRPRGPLWIVAALVALHVGYYAFVQRSYYNWYAMPLVLGAAVLQGDRLARARPAVRVAAVVASAALCAVTLGWCLQRYPRMDRMPERTVDHLLRAIDALPPNARVGAWNAGRIGYFAELRRPDVTVWNLDCVVNNALFAAWRAGRYTPWVVANVDWLVEHPQGELDRAVATQTAPWTWKVAAP